MSNHLSDTALSAAITEVAVLLIAGTRLALMHYGPLSNPHQPSAPAGSH